MAKKEPKIGTNIAQYKEAMAQWQQATTEAQSNIAFWEEVKAVASQRNQPTEETAPVVEVEEQAEETTEAEQPTEEVAEEVAEEQTPIAETQAENTQSVAETQAETTEEQSAEEETPQIEEEQPKEEAPQAEQTEVAEETPTEEQPSAETAEEQPQAEQTEEVTEEYINEVIDKLRDVYESLANEAQTDINNNLESFKAEVASRTDEEIATAIADIESTPDLVELFERVRNGLLSGEIKGTKQEEQDLINALQRIAQGNVAKNTLLPIFIAEQQKRAEQQTESKTESQPKAKAKPKATSKATPKTTAKAKTPKRKKEVNFFKYILPKKERELRPVLAGVFMRDGYRVASDTHILIAERAEYSPALEGRVINEDGIALIDKEGNPIINNLAWQRVIPTPENSSLVLTPIESIMAMLEQAKPLNKIFADDAPYNGNTATEIEIETENGPAFFDSAKLALFMDFVLTIDNPTLAYGNKTRSIWVTSADGSKKAVLMGLASESDRVEAIRISTRKGIEVGADFSYNNKKTNGLKSELKESEDYIALMKAQPVPPRRELSFHEKKVAQLKALIAIREGKTEFHVGDYVTPNSTQAQQLATKAVMMVLTENRLEPIIATDAMTEAVLGNSAFGFELMAVVEAKRRADAIEGLTPINVTRNSKSKEELSEDYKNLPSVEKDGRVIEFYNSAFKKIYKEGGLFAQVVPQLDEILNQSILAYSEADNLGGTMRPDGTIHKAHPNVDAFDNYVGKVEFDGKEYYVRTTVKRQEGEAGTHSFFVTEVAVYEKSANGLSEPNFPSGESDHQRIIDTKLQQFFDYANGKLNNPEFQIVFHGSRAKFDAFDHSHMGEGEGAQAYGWGTYVTEVEGVGKQYAIRMRDSAISDKHKENAIINNLARQTLASNNGNNAEALDYLRGLLNESWSDKKRVKAQIKIIETGKFLPETKVKARLYTVEVPDYNGSNYVSWKADNNQETIDKLNGAYRAMLLERGVPAEDISPYFEPFGKGLSGESIYKLFVRELGGEKQASEFLHRMGFVGIKYPTYNMSGGNTKGQSNYVIFNEADAKIVNRIEFLRTPQGTIYGWTDGKRIYLTRDGMNPETPVHEYTHLWARAMMQNNAEGWQSIKDLLRDTPVWSEVVNDDNYANIRGDEDAIASEALSRLSGKNGAQKMTDMAQQLINEGNPQAQTLIGRIRQALQEFWNWVGVNLFDIQNFESIEQVTDRVLWDMVQGTNLGMLESGGVEFMGSRVEKRRAEIAEHFNGQQLSGNGLSIVNAFAYGSKNEVIEVNGKRIVLKQGNENKAGVSHSLMRHYGTSTGNYSADELLLMPQVIEQGERKQDGKKVSYKMDINGVTYSVTTEIKGQHEEFTNFFTNRRPTVEEQGSSNTVNQHEQPQQSVSADEVTNNSSNTQEDGELLRPGDEITMNNVAANLYIESGIYIKELNKLPHLFGSYDGKLNDAQATIENAKKRIEILDEYKAMIVEDMMPNATKPAQEYLQKQVDRINETIDFLNEVIANPEEASHNPKRFTNRFLFRPEEDAADSADTFTSAAEAIAQQLGVEIEIDESMPAKGSYNPRTGRIRINPSRHATAEDIQRTVLHETIGHGGIQAVAGKRFGQVCQQVYDMMTEGPRSLLCQKHQ